MRTALAIVAMLLLSACQQVPTREPLLTEVKTVPGPPVIVKEPCLKPEDVPALPKSVTPPSKGSDIYQLMSGIWVDVGRLMDVVQKQNDLLVSCSKLTQGSKP
jgi:hypothetical protein